MATVNPDSMGIPAKLFPAVFPFHVSFNARGEIAQTGRVLHRICPEIAEGNRLDRHFRMVMPETPMDVEAIRAHAGAAFVLESIQTGLRLRGQMVPLEPSGLTLFLGSPYVADVRDLSAVGLTLGDLPPHDATAELLTVIESKNAALADTNHLAASLSYSRAELDTRNRELHVHGAITQALAECKSLAQVGAAALAPVCEIFTWEFGALWLWDAPAHVLRCAAVWNAAPAELAAFESATRQATIASGAGLAGHVFSRGEAGFSTDLAVDTGGDRARPADAFGFQGGVAFPVLSVGEPIGVLEFFGRQVRPADHAVLNLMRPVAAKIALFLKRTEAEAGMRRYAEELTEAKLRVEAQTLELIRTGEELARARDAALAANELKSAILTNMSQRICAPLDGIAGLAGVVLDTDLTQEQRENLTAVKATAESLRAVLNDILDLSQVEAGTLNLRKAPFSLRRAIRDALKPLGVWAASKPMEFVYRVEDDVPDLVTGDPTRLRQVLVNLTAHAIQSTQRGGVAVRVDLQSRESDRIVTRFSVTDTGIGIPREKQMAVWGNSGPPEGEGSGPLGGTDLGLCVSLRLIELMGGNLELASDVGKGSSFLFSLPLGIGTPAPRKRARNTSQPSGAAPLGQASLAGLKVLVADDNPVNQKLTARLLEKHGSSVTVAGNGAEAVAALSREPFDLVLMDVQMPEMDGLEATAAIRARERPGEKRLPIVAMTANPRNRRATCLASGMDGFLRKPIRVPQLLAAIEPALGVRGGLKTLTAGAGPPRLETAP